MNKTAWIRMYRRRLMILLIALFLLLCSGSILCAAQSEWDGNDWRQTTYFELVGNADASLFLDATEDAPYLSLYGCSAKELTLGAHVQALWLYECNISAYRVDAANPYLTAVDGVLFSKDLSTLVSYPTERQSTHYDVPRGTKQIREYAFTDADGLSSVSLPLGLEQIGQAAFNRTGLVSVVLPLTVRTVQDYAFANCVCLSSVSVPRGAVLGRDVFDNCPLLNADAFPGDEAPVYTERELQSWERNSRVCVVASPQNAGDKVYLYTAPDGRTRLKGYEYSSGQSIGYVMACNEEWYKMSIGFVYWDEELKQAVYNTSYAYMRRAQVTIQPGQTLFTYANVFPQSDRTAVYELEGGSAKKRGTYGEWKKALQKRVGEMDDALLYADYDQVGWFTLTYMDDDVYDMISFRMSDAAMTRRAGAEQNTYGVVVASEPANRVNLRQQADRSSRAVAKYYSGTQLQVLGQSGDWYRVRIGFTEGWMMKEYVTIVPPAGM